MIAINNLDQAIEAARTPTQEKISKCSKPTIDPPMTASIYLILKIYNLIILIIIVPKVEKPCYKKLLNKVIVKLCNSKF